MPVSLRGFAIIKLTVYKFKEGCAFPSVRRETAVHGFFHNLGIRFSLYILKNEKYIKKKCSKGYVGAPISLILCRSCYEERVKACVHL